MSHYPALLHPITLNAVVEPGPVHPEACQQIRLVHEHGFIDTWTWATIPSVPASCLRKAVAYLIPVGEADRGLHVVTRFDWSHTMDPLSLVPDSLGMTDDVVYRCREVVEAMTTEPLRRFLDDVFSTPEVFYGYWRTPLESRRAPGSLALASVALAEAIRDARSVPMRERDLAITFAMLRHVGAVWCLQDDWNGLGILQQDLVALSQLDGPFDQLASEAPALSISLRQLMLAQRAPVQDAAAQTVKKLVAQVEAHQALQADLDPVKAHRREENDEVAISSQNVIEFPRISIRGPVPDEHTW